MIAPLTYGPPPFPHRPRAYFTACQPRGAPAFWRRPPAVARGRIGAGLARDFAGALAREVEERRFFLWLPVAAMGGVALNLAADSEPVAWLPAALTALFPALALASRARPVAFGVSLAFAALAGGFLAMSLRTARVAAPVLDRIRIVCLHGYVEEVDLRPVGARMVIAVMSADGMPAREGPASRAASRRAKPRTSPRATMWR